MIAIIDYGMGNIHSVKKALESMGARTVVTSNAALIKKCDKAVLPGVGAFGDAMQELERQGLVAAIKGHIEKNKSFLGICLGMHLLFESSQESPGVKGLGIFKGAVKKFPKKKSLKVPHMGWNQLRLKEKKCPLFNGLADLQSVYFCHSYYPAAKDRKIMAATTKYGIEFPSVIRRDKVFATQFHPEKSQKVGLKILENFVSL
jgi:glutamine amidotransferase